MLYTSSDQTHSARTQLVNSYTNAFNQSVSQSESGDSFLFSSSSSFDSFVDFTSVHAGAFGFSEYHILNGKSFDLVITRMEPTK